MQALESAREEKEAHGEIESFHLFFFAKMYQEAMAVIATDLLNDKVLSFWLTREGSAKDAVREAAQTLTGRQTVNAIRDYRM